MVVVQRGEKAGIVVKIHGTLRQQFQGKELKSLREHPSLAGMIKAYEARTLELTHETLFCSVVNTPDSFLLIDESEIKVEEETKPKLGLIDGGKDDSGTTDQTDSSNVKSSGHDEPTCGRSVSSTESVADSDGQEAQSTEADSSDGSGIGAVEDGDSQPEEPTPIKPKSKTKSKPTSK